MRRGKAGSCLVLGAIILAMAALAAGSCIKGSDQKESKPIAFIETAGGRLNLVDGFGTRSALPYSTTVTHDLYYLDCFFTPGMSGVWTLSRDGWITGIDFTTGSENEIFQLKVPAAGSIIKARLGWAGERLYVLADAGPRGVLLDQLDQFAILGSGDTVIGGPFNGLGPGLENPVSFDLANGGSQIYLLYASGKLMAHSLYAYQEPEGEVADFGPGAADAHVMPDGAIYVGGQGGIYEMPPGGAPSLLDDPGPVKLLRVDAPDDRDVFIATTDNKVYRWLHNEDVDFLYLANPDEVTGITPIADAWIKNTKPLIEDPVSAGQYYALAVNPYALYFTDPDGDLADVTAVIYSDTVSGVFFGNTSGTLSGETIITFPGAAAGTGLNATFWGGDTVGQMTIHVEADSSDGQVSVRDFRLNLEDYVIPLP